MGSEDRGARRPLIAGNWKMYKGPRETGAFIKEFLPLVAANVEVEIVLCPAFVSLPAAIAAGEGKAIKIGAQDTYWEREGAFTGEVSPAMLAEVGCRYCIVGHSERRHLFGETDAGVNRKVRALLEVGLTPIICVGETLAQREAGQSREVCREQLVKALEGLLDSQVAGVVVAYEPIWAIGTGHTATPEDAQEVSEDLRRLIKNPWDQEAARQVRILYGGSVKPANTAMLMAQPDIDGALVGGASLVPDDLAAIINYTAEVKQCAPGR